MSRWRSYSTRLKCGGTTSSDASKLLEQSSNQSLDPEARVAALMELVAREIETIPIDDLTWVKRVFDYGLDRIEMALVSREATRRRRPSFVYFAQQRSGAGDGPIKIGVSRDPHNRKAVLQTGSVHRIDLLAVVPGDSRLEQAYHQQFASDRMNGEWFRPSTALLAFIASLTAGAR